MTGVNMAQALSGTTNLAADVFFPNARRYAHPRETARGSVREPRGSPFFPWTERHLQCVWFDPALRPAALRTNGGERVTVEDPGVWNLEAGPDFLGAAVRIEPGNRRMVGDVELHIHPKDWTAHRHADDRRYDRVRIHVSFFPGSPGHGPLPPGTVQLALRDALAADPSFDFGSIDVAGYPFAARGKQPPCARILEPWGAADIESLLTAAGEERLRRKTEWLQYRIETAGEEQALYEELMGALGYKHNKTPFRRLAEAVPLADLQREADGDARTAYALLAGVAGLLPARASVRWDAETRAFVRTAWDAWWKRREEWESRIIPAAAWRLAGVRPANHPARRLMAAAVLFGTGDSPAARWAETARAHPEDCVTRIAAQLAKLDGGYWARRLSLGGTRQKRPVALIGETRADAIAMNVLVPHMAARGVARPFRQGLLDRLPREPDNGIVRHTAFALLGPDHPPSLYRDSVRKQGLLQIFHDYCLNDRSRCASCGFPDLLRAYRDSHAHQKP